VVRCGILDRLVENKMYYKFAEYGNRVKEKRMVDEKKREKEEEKRELLERQGTTYESTFDNSTSAVGASRSGSFKRPNKVGALDKILLDQNVEADESDRQNAKDEDRIHAEIMNKGLFEESDGERDDLSDSMQSEGRQKGVRWGADVVEHNREEKKEKPDKVNNQ